MANLSHLPAQWRTSGLTQQAFCDREGISLATFSYWRGKELRGELASNSASATIVQQPQFTEVVVEATPPASRAIEIVLPEGTVVRIPIIAPC